MAWQHGSGDDARRRSEMGIEGTAGLNRFFLSHASVSRPFSWPEIVPCIPMSPTYPHPSAHRGRAAGRRAGERARVSHPTFTVSNFNVATGLTLGFQTGEDACAGPKAAAGETRMSRKQQTMLLWHAGPQIMIWARYFMRGAQHRRKL